MVFQRWIPQLLLFFFFFVCWFFASKQYAGNVDHHQSLRKSVVRALYGLQGSHEFESHQEIR